MMKQLIGNPAFKKVLMVELEKAAKEEKLRGFEVVKNIFLEAEAFSIDNGLISPTFKLKRNEAAVSHSSCFHVLRMYISLFTLKLNPSRIWIILGPLPSTNKCHVPRDQRSREIETSC
jgi:hypothetical protein